MLSNSQKAAVQEAALPCGRALVIDEDDRDLETYTGVLQRMGFDVKTFTNYQEASRCLDEGIPDFVFVNQGSTAFETRSVVEQVLARDRHVPVVVLARCLHMGCYLEAMQLGAVDYVEKPLAPDDLEYLVATYLQPRPRHARRAVSHA